jgi:hypothetical protein
MVGVDLGPEGPGPQDLDLRNLDRGVLCMGNVIVCTLCWEGVISQLHVLIRIIKYHIFAALYFAIDSLTLVLYYIVSSELYRRFWVRANEAECCASRILPLWMTRKELINL